VNLQIQTRPGLRIAFLSFSTPQTVFSQISKNRSPTNESSTTTTTTATKTEGIVRVGTGGSSSATSRSCGSSILAEVYKGRSSNARRGIVVVLSSRLKEFHGDAWQVVDVLADNDRSDDQNKKDDEHEEVQDSVSDHASLTETGLLDRINRWSNLTARSQPEEHD